MIFKDIREGNIGINEKQRLNLSKRAYTILLQDCELFEPQKDAKTPGGAITSNLINHIMSCWRNEASSSISVMKANRRKELTELLKDELEPKVLERVLDRALEKSVAEWGKTALQRCKDKEVPFSFRFNQDNFKYLAEECAEENEVYDKNVGRYVKALIEEYCELPYVERERVYCREILDIENITRSNGGMMKLTLHQIDRKTGKNKILYLKPYGVMRDAENLYHYLVGVGGDSREKCELIQSVRLTSILSASELSTPGTLTGKKKDEIEKKIHQYGVQYLSSAQSETPIRVKLTEDGKTLYRRIHHLRPIYTKIDGDVYEFDCTLFQAETYFFRFGKDAQVLEPPELVRTMRDKFTAAAAVYRNQE